MDDEEWQDPVLERSGIDRRRLVIRLGCSLGVALVLVILTRGFLAEATGVLWPPTEPLAQWVTFVLLTAFGYVLVPVMIGSFVADIALERAGVDSETE